MCFNLGGDYTPRETDAKTGTPASTSSSSITAGYLAPKPAISNGGKLMGDRVRDAATGAATRPPSLASLIFSQTPTAR